MPDLQEGNCSLQLIKSSHSKTFPTCYFYRDSGVEGFQPATPAICREANVPAAGIHPCLLLLILKRLPNTVHHHLFPVFQSLGPILISPPPHFSCLEQKTCHHTSGLSVVSCKEAMPDTALPQKFNTTLFSTSIDL